MYTEIHKYGKCLLLNLLQARKNECTTTSNDQWLTVAATYVHQQNYKTATKTRNDNQTPPKITQ